MNTYAKELARRVAEGSLTAILMFNGEFRWLSNFYLGPGMEYTVEHEFQAAKYADGSIGMLNVMKCMSPGAAKRLGRQAKLPEDWDICRLHVMKAALVKKFSISPMREWLIATGDIPLTEGNYWHDNYWGNCACSRCAGIPGVNMLGLLLMEVRTGLRESANAP